MQKVQQKQETCILSENKERNSGRNIKQNRRKGEERFVM